MSDDKPAERCAYVYYDGQDCACLRDHPIHKDGHAFVPPPAPECECGHPEPHDHGEDSRPVFYPEPQPPAVDARGGEILGCGADCHECDEVPALRARIAALERAIEEVASSGVEFEDERVSYVSVQIDRALWLELKSGCRRG